MVTSRAIVVLAFAAGLRAPAQDPAFPAFERAYAAVQAHDWDGAIAAFREGIRLAPDRVSARKDLAYTLLKTGDTEAARDQFAEAVRLQPDDRHAALEYAFLCFETKRQAEARRVFDSLRKNGDQESRRTAEQAFQNIDRALEEGIRRWSHAVELNPGSWTAHEELAGLAEQRDQPGVAVEHYEAAWKLRPQERRLLLDIGRTRQALGNTAEANAALLAASRGAQNRVAERARALLPARYPYVYEFREALSLDPANLDLRRELAYLLLEMGEKAAAELEFANLVRAAPSDLLSSAQLGFLRLARKDVDGAMPLLEAVLAGDDDDLADRVRAALQLPRALRRRPEAKTREQIGNEAKELAARSLQKGYLKDALKYLTLAHENDPVDFGVMLKLGWAYNVLRQDDEAVKWFSLARRSPDRATAAEADRAWHNLRPQFARVRTTFWTFPFFSTRWHDLFTYAQAKTDFRIGRWPVRPYVSLRFMGDARSKNDPAMRAQYLSESSFVAAVGITSETWKGIRGWFEAGEAINYLGKRTDIGFMVPDYRGGVSFGRGFGHLLTGSGRGWFAETTADGVFVSRFGNDMIGYAQNRAGYTARATEGGWQTQFYWNWNITRDAQGQDWANFIEQGPGFRIRMPLLPNTLLFSANALRGRYLIREGNPREPVFHDFRAGFWYAFTR